MKVNFSVKMQVMYMYDFLMSHTYRGPAGLISVGIGIAAFVLCFSTIGKVQIPFTLCYGFIGILSLLYLPFTLYQKAQKQVQGVPMFKKPLDYTIDKLGISTRQENEQAFVEWKDIVKVRATRRSVIVYMTKVRAFVWPRECIGKQYDTLVKLMNGALPKEKIRLK